MELCVRLLDVLKFITQRRVWFERFHKSGETACEACGRGFGRAAQGILRKKFDGIVIGAGL